MKVLIIGGGRAGTSMGYLLKSNDFKIIGIYNKHFNSAVEAARLIGEGVPLTENKLERTLIKAELIMITTPDDQISKIASEITDYNLRKPVYLMHMSGLLSSNILNKGGKSGIYKFSLHPLQSIANFKEGIKLLPDSYFTLEGDNKGKKCGKNLVESLNLNYGLIESEYKPLYHIAAVIASNYFITLLNSSFNLLGEAGIDNEKIRQGILSLVQGTLNNIKEMGTESALTGPVVRGDLNTIKKHLRALENFESEYIELYKTLGRFTVDMVINNVSLKDYSRREELKSILSEFQEI